MTIQQLNYVVALDIHRHFVKAAESCAVSQPTLTNQVKKLEDQINLTLFDRKTQPLKPTPMGEVFIAKARKILREIDQLKALVNEEQSQVKGKFKLGIIPSLSQYILPKFLHHFSKAYPNTHLEIKEWRSEQIMKGLDNGDLNVGLMVTPLYENTLREIPIFYEPFLLYAQEGHTLLKKEQIIADELKSKDLWLLEEGHCFRNQILNFCQFKKEKEQDKNIVFESASIETLKLMIQQTGGYTLIPELAYNQFIDQDKTKRFSTPEPVREVSLVVHKSFTKELLLTHLHESIQKNIPMSFRKKGRNIMVDWR
ncbi:hydrogen peroxide-inducible genes activator [Flammeovirga sp. SJP92]|uniref:hydrogen peroxide-inducible genes activator n=1 Tax=Flammeovirga sp. SJP92 TaxID=1775430 RepID=UPI000787ADD5|nr:hydrogen peroxide-inducible genes activator [Flammeovirga sp. SJP92]KXX67926.1 hypothetical protein AVL50_24015 [Flammeovirga sp. SJP92]